MKYLIVMLLVSVAPNYKTEQVGKHILLSSNTEIVANQINGTTVMCGMINELDVSTVNEKSKIGCWCLTPQSYDFASPVIILVNTSLDHCKSKH